MDKKTDPNNNNSDIHKKKTSSGHQSNSSNNKSKKESSNTSSINNTPSSCSSLENEKDSFTKDFLTKFATNAISNFNSFEEDDEKFEYRFEKTKTLEQEINQESVEEKTTIQSPSDVKIPISQSQPIYPQNIHHHHRNSGPLSSIQEEPDYEASHHHHHHHHHPHPHQQFGHQKSRYDGDSFVEIDINQEGLNHESITPKSDSTVGGNIPPQHIGHKRKGSNGSTCSVNDTESTSSDVDLEANAYHHHYHHHHQKEKQKRAGIFSPFSSLFRGDKSSQIYKSSENSPNLNNPTAVPMRPINTSNNSIQNSNKRYSGSSMSGGSEFDQTLFTNTPPPTTTQPQPNKSHKMNQSIFTPSPNDNSSAKKFGKESGKSSKVGQETNDNSSPNLGSYRSTINSGFSFTQSPKTHHNILNRIKKKVKGNRQLNNNQLTSSISNSAFNQSSHTINHLNYNISTTANVSNSNFLDRYFDSLFNDLINSKYFFILKYPWRFASWILRPTSRSNYTSKVFYRRAHVLNLLSIVMCIIFILATILQHDIWYIFSPGILITILLYIMGKTSNYLYLTSFLLIATCTAINITAQIVEIARGNPTTKFEFSWDVLVMIAVPLLFPSVLYSISLTLCVAVAYISMGAYIDASNKYVLIDGQDSYGESIRSIVIVFLLLMMYSILSSIDLKEIERKEARIQSLFKISNEALVVHKDGLISDANPAFESIFQIKLNDMLYPVQSGIWEFLPALEGMFDHDGNKTLDIGDIGVIETTAIDSSGRTFQVEVRTNKATYGGQPVDVISIIDITGRKQLIEADVALRKAEAANEAKVIFLTTVSHELRTPINGVLASADILERTNLDSTQKEFLTCIKLSGNYLLDLINDILDYSKIEAGRMEIVTFDFSLLKMLDNSIRIVSKNVYQKNLELCLFIDGNVPILLNGDSGRIKQILLNFLSNSIKFTNKGQICVRVKLDSQIEKEITLRIEVEDSGIGIKQEHIGNLFTAFSQIDSGNSRKYQGTGLGLSICKRLCKMMGGNVYVSSEFGVGSTFSFTVKCTAPSLPTLTIQNLGSAISLGQEIPGISKPIGKKKYMNGVIGIVLDINPYVRKSVVLFFGLLNISCVELSSKADLDEHLSTLTSKSKNLNQVYVVVTSCPDINQTTVNTPKDRKFSFILMENPNEDRRQFKVFDGRFPKPCQFSDIVKCLYHVETLNFFIDSLNVTPIKNGFGIDGQQSTSESQKVSTVTSPVSYAENAEQIKNLDPISSPVPCQRAQVSPSSLILSPNSRRSSLNDSLNGSLLPDPALDEQNHTADYPINMESVYQKIESHHQNFKRSMDSRSHSTATSPLLSKPVSSSSTITHHDHHLSSPTSPSFKLPLPPSYVPHPPNLPSKSLPTTPTLRSRDDDISSAVEEFRKKHKSSHNIQAHGGNGHALLPLPPPHPSTTTTTTTNSNNISSGSSSKAKDQHRSIPQQQPKIEERTEKILLVEDNAVNIKIFSKLLKDSHFKFDVASNGIEAVNRVKSEEYDLILMDCQMPEMDGFEATKIIRDLEKNKSIKPPPSHKHPHIIIVALTANSGYEDKQKCLQVGMNDFLQKPIKTADSLIQMN
ncbi:hypothetical protein CYY_000534 [Polysphondylium violaceum]|uniref:Histidine kinase n=1 Tax=Polysphondylium violaceum TaxID=133409 RepID=A0A8J4V2B6_9MYCE|nr:hypothetical protein CYY_000534 [Polysphondylium violaceum]